MTPIRPLALIASLILLAAPAGATGFTLSTAVTEIVPVKTGAQYHDVVISNQSSGAIVSCTDDGSDPVIGAANSYDILPGDSRKWGGGSAAQYAGPFRCTASAAATPVSVTAR